MEKVLYRPIQAPIALTERGEILVKEAFFHKPVLLAESVRNLAVQPEGVYIDCTIGEGGHASAILGAAMPGGKLLGIDLDPQALDHARARLEPYWGYFTLAKGNYCRVEELAGELGFAEPTGILLDLGMSSLQLENPGRGFSLQRDEPLDMRFDPEEALTAADIVNHYPLVDLIRIISSYGEEPRARSVARAIAQCRPLRTTSELACLVADVSGGRRGRIHPATRTFQALRIEVNSELDNLRFGLHQAIGLLRPGARLVVISYHSLEDRIVKETFAQEARGCICPPQVPVCGCGHTPSLKIVSKRVVRPSPAEIRGNPRSRSARLRVAERLQTT